MDDIVLLVVLAMLIIGCMVGIVIFLNRRITSIESRFGQPTSSDSQVSTIVQSELQNMRHDIDSMKETVKKTSTDLCDRIDVRMDKTKVDLNTMMNQTQQNMNTTLMQTQQNMTTVLTRTDKTITDIHTDLGNVKAAQDQIKGLDSSIKKMENIFSSPKLRGGVGEFQLEMILDDALPGQWESQHSFNDGTLVDAAIRIKDKIVPIDAKFPLDKYQAWVSIDNEQERKIARKDLNKAIEFNISGISEKYIKPVENTMDFALMYLPSNKMYYEIFLHDEAEGEGQGLYKYAFDKKVFPICPATLFMYLQAIAMGLKGMKIEEDAQVIIKRLDNVRKKFDNFLKEYQRMEDTIDKLNKGYEQTMDNFRKFDDEIERILRLKPDQEEPEPIEKA